LEELKGRSRSFPGGQPDEEMLKWFLRDRGMDVEEAVGKLKKVTAWRAKASFALSGSEFTWAI